MENERKPVLAVCMNAAWQKTLCFKEVREGQVNRAVESHETGGGKGVNVGRVLSRLGYPVMVAAFVGGQTGEYLKNEFARTGIGGLTVASRSRTRCCYTVISQKDGQATELIEPSGRIEPDERDAMKALLKRELPKFGAVALCGSLPPGVETDIYAEVAAQARELRIPVVLDAVSDIGRVLEEGVTVLKINREELNGLCSCDEGVVKAGKTLLTHYKGLQRLVVTCGEDYAWYVSRRSVWRFDVPRLNHVVSPIGAGDCATALVALRLSEEPCPTERAMASIVAEALACASASCLTDTPSVYDPAVARRLQSTMGFEAIE